MHFDAALKELHSKPGETRYEPDHSRPKGQYLHLQLTPNMWNKLEKTKTLPKKRHTHTKGDKWWMSKCLKDPAVREGKKI